MPETVSVKGLAELQRDLNKLDKELGKELKKIGKSAADIVAREAKTLVPVRSGTLRNSIKPGATAKGAKVSAGGSKAGAYVHPIHFGWPRHHIKKHPFLYEALDSKRDEVIEQYARDIDALVDRTITGKEL